MSMLRSLDRDDTLADVVHIHSSRTPEGVIFGEQLRVDFSRSAQEGPSRPDSNRSNREGSSRPRET